MEDTEILALFERRAQEAIVHTKEKYGDVCRGLAFSVLRSHEDTEECENEALLILWNSIPPAKPDRLKAYLLKIIRNCALTRYRKSRAKKRGGDAELRLAELEECIPSGGGVEQETDARALTEALNRFLETQPERERMVFVRRYFYCEPVAEVAERFGLTESNAKVILLRVRRKLNDYLAKEGILNG
ncbi:MAG: sigma-70 family RNA polymerase sigma factor [Oscillospiraceae bacterium]